MAEFTIISIGTLSHNRLWNEAAAVRTPHATTTLVTDADRSILVDPSLPGQILEAKFFERTGGRLNDVTDVFLTTLRPVHRRGLEHLEHANWWASEPELEAYRGHLEELLDSADRLGQEEAATVHEDMRLVRKIQAAPERFAPQVQLYPLPGASVGSAGLVLTPTTSTIVIAGDAALTREHLRAGQIWDGCVDAEVARETLTDLLEVADVIVPGHDNVLFCSQRWF
ncbi:MAG: MBL fold metallo-hydrolase [Phycisphaerae bacterium]